MKCKCKKLENRRGNKFRKHETKSFVSTTKNSPRYFICEKVKQFREILPILSKRNYFS